jgi:hypothetical protein
MAGSDAVRANVKALVAKNLLNVAVEKEEVGGGASLGKRDPGDPGKEKPPAEAEQSFVRSRA